MGRLAPALALLIAAASLAHPVRAQQPSPDDAPPPLLSDPPTTDQDINAAKLHFSRLQLGSRTGLLVWGHVDSGDSERFRTVIKAVKPIAQVQFFSGGGDLEEGLQIGRIMRAAGLVARIPAGYQCISACNFMFLGGIARSIDPGGVFGVHMFDSAGAPSIMVDAFSTAVEVAGAAVTSQPPVAQAKEGPVAKPTGSGGPDPAPSPVAEPRLLVGADRVDAILSRLGCDRRTDIEPEDLAARIEQRLVKIEERYQRANSVLDPALRARFGAELQVLTLINLCIEQGDATTAAEIARFLVDMRLSLRFLTAFASIPNARWRALTRDELRDYNIVNTE